MVITPELISADIDKEIMHYAHEYCTNADPESMMEDFVTGHRNLIRYGYADISSVEFDDEAEYDAVHKNLKYHSGFGDMSWYLGKDDRLGMMFDHVIC